MQSKEQILETYPELELTDCGDFVIRKELVEGYEIIDFHTHTFSSIAGSLPGLFRKEMEDNQASFFDLSCYPGEAKYFNLDAIGYRTWPESLFTTNGIGTAADLLGFRGVIPLLRKAATDRLLRDMSEGSVAQSVILPINTQHFDATGALIDSISGSEYLLPFGSIHPYEDKIENKVESCLSKGVRGFKINPHIQKVDIDDDRMIDLVRLLADTSLPILSCCGLALPDHIARQLPGSFQNNLETQNLDRYEKVLSHIPEAIFIFAHGGLEQNSKLIDLMQKFPNTYSDISTQPPANIKRMIDTIGSHRLLFGSDYPFFNQAFPILSVLRATGEHEAREAIFAANARRLLHLIGR